MSLSEWKAHPSPSRPLSLSNRPPSTPKGYHIGLVMRSMRLAACRPNNHKLAPGEPAHLRRSVTTIGPKVSRFLSLSYRVSYHVISLVTCSARRYSPGSVTMLRRCAPFGTQYLCNSRLVYRDCVTTGANTALCSRVP